MKLSLNDSFMHNISFLSIKCYNNDRNCHLMTVWILTMRSLELTLQHHPRPYLTEVELDILLKGTRDSRYGKVKRLLAQGKLIRIRRGLYSPTEAMGCFKKPHSFELAQYIYGPSCISLESALSYHRLIPEAVYTITSVVGKRSKEFNTPLGVFSYCQLPLHDLYTEVERIHEKEHTFYLAKPWRAVCDYVYYYRKDWDSFSPLLNSLRMNIENLPILQREEMQLLEDYYQHHRLSRFLKGIQKDNYYRAMKRGGGV